MMSSSLEKKSTAGYGAGVIKPPQIRGARAMLGMTQAQLATAAGISTTGLNNIERGDADPKASTLNAIRTALESAGVIFVEENGEGPGVRLKKERSAEAIAAALKALDEEHAQLGPTPSPHKALNRMRAAIVEDKHKKR